MSAGEGASKRSAEPSDGQTVLEDVTGFNFRSLRTVRDLFVRPNAVFLAYAAKDRVTYAPPVRVWLGIIGLQIVFSILYGGYGAIVADQFAAMDAETRTVLEGAIGDLGAFTEAYGEVAAVLHPLIVGGFTALSLFALMPLNKTIGWPVRLNLTFAVLVAGSVVGLLAMIPYVFERRIGGWTMVPVVLTYFVTYVRGAPGVLANSRAAALGKGLVFSLVMVALVLAGGVVLTLVSGTAAAILVTRG